jgi:NAD(P)H-hydrate epimerase
LRQVGGFVYVTADEMKAIDEATIQKYKIDVLSLMENAGVATALLARRMLGGSVRRKRVACLTGKGNNGGDGLVASRHLSNWGAKVAVILSSGREELGGVGARQFESVQATGAAILGVDADLTGYDLLLDALLGYNSKGAPREPIAGLIRRANDSQVPILAVDIPSGLDPTTGTPNDPCIVARATLTLALPKTGFLNPESRRFVGDLYLGDVSIPLEVYRSFHQTAPLFDEGQVVSIR